VAARETQKKFDKVRVGARCHRQDYSSILTAPVVPLHGVIERHRLA